jgi:hypothetical protein
MKDKLYTVSHQDILLVLNLLKKNNRMLEMVVQKKDEINTCEFITMLDMLSDRLKALTVYLNNVFTSAE